MHGPRARARARLTCTALLAFLTGTASAAPLPAPDAIVTVLDRLGGGDLVLFDPPRAGEATRIFLAGRVRAGAAEVRKVLVDPQAYRRAVPSFERADVVGRRGGDLQVAWELEVPLWNLRGKLWLRPTADGVDLELAEGDLSPGLFRVRLAAGVLSIEARANVRNANWLARRVAARSPLSEPAMTAVAAWVLLRALVEEIEHDPRRHPTGPPTPPAVQVLEGTALGRAALPLLAAGVVAAAVHGRADGRLERVEVAVAAPFEAGVTRRALAEPQRWRALPGWRSVDVHPGVWDVDTHLPFVDLGARWSVQPGPPFRAVAVSGDRRGALLGWDVVPAGPARAVAVFSLHPRLDRAGYIPRKFIDAEPLLEHGLSLGLAYVDAVSLVRALGGQRSQVPTP